MDESTLLRPVSYTHLDVYKRQVKSEGDGTRIDSRSESEEEERRKSDCSDVV